MSRRPTPAAVSPGVHPWRAPVGQAQWHETTIQGMLQTHAESGTTHDVVEAVVAITRQSTTIGPLYERLANVHMEWHWTDFSRLIYSPDREAHVPSTLDRLAFVDCVHLNDYPLNLSNNEQITTLLLVRCEFESIGRRELQRRLLLGVSDDPLHDATVVDSDDEDGEVEDDDLLGDTFAWFKDGEIHEKLIVLSVRECQRVPHELCMAIWEREPAGLEQLQWCNIADMTHVNMDLRLPPKLKYLDICGSPGLTYQLVCLMWSGAQLPSTLVYLALDAGCSSFGLLQLILRSSLNDRLRVLHIECQSAPTEDDVRHWNEHMDRPEVSRRRLELRLRVPESARNTVFRTAAWSDADRLSDKVQRAVQDLERPFVVANVPAVHVDKVDVRMADYDCGIVDEDEDMDEQDEDELDEQDEDELDEEPAPKRRRPATVKKPNSNSTIHKAVDATPPETAVQPASKPDSQKRARQSAPKNAEETRLLQEFKRVQAIKVRAPGKDDPPRPDTYVDEKTDTTKLDTYWSLPHTLTASSALSMCTHMWIPGGKTTICPVIDSSVMVDGVFVNCNSFLLTATLAERRLVEIQQLHSNELRTFIIDDRKLSVTYPKQLFSDWPMDGKKTMHAGMAYRRASEVFKRYMSGDPLSTQSSVERIVLQLDLYLDKFHSNAQGDSRKRQWYPGVRTYSVRHHMENGMCRNRAKRLGLVVEQGNVIFSARYLIALEQDDETNVDVLYRCASVKWMMHVLSVWHLLYRFTRVRQVFNQHCPDAARTFKRLTTFFDLPVGSWSTGLPKSGKFYGEMRSWWQEFANGLKKCSNQVNEIVEKESNKKADGVK